MELRSFGDAKASAVSHWRSIRPLHRGAGDGERRDQTDRQLVARDPVDLGGGFGLEVRRTMGGPRQPSDSGWHGAARNERILFSRNLIGTLRQRELDALGDTLAAETGICHSRNLLKVNLSPARTAGAVRVWPLRHDRRRPRLQAGAMDPVDRETYRAAYFRVARADGGVDWSFGRKRGLGL